MITNDSFYKREQNMKKIRMVSQNLWDKIKSHKLQIGSSLITTNRIMTHFTTVIMFMIAFHLIEEHLPYAMAFLALLGIFGFVFDVIQNVVALKYEKEELFEYTNEQKFNEEKFKSSVK